MTNWCRKIFQNAFLVGAFKIYIYIYCARGLTSFLRFFFTIDYYINTVFLNYDNEIM
jgi:hypothetical protein